MPVVIYLGIEVCFHVENLAGCDSDEVHIVFDIYRGDSIKNAERKRRGKSKEMVVIDVISLNQKVSVVLENFGHLLSAKLPSRQFRLNGSPSIMKAQHGKCQLGLLLIPSTRLHACRG